MYTLYWHKGTGDKKYKVVIFKNNKKHKTVQFGNINYEHYHDKTPLGLYSHLNHNDEKRRKNYRARHSKIKNKKGEYVYNKKFTPSWFSMRFLWD